MRSGTVVVSRVSVGQTEVQFAGLTDTRHQLLLLTLGLVAPVGEDFLLGPDLTVVLDVFGDGQVRDCSSGHRDGLTAERTDGNLHRVCSVLTGGNGHCVPGYFSCRSCYNCDGRTGGDPCKIFDCRRHTSWEGNPTFDRLAHCNVSPGLVTPFCPRLIL